MTIIHEVDGSPKDAREESLWIEGQQSLPMQSSLFTRAEAVERMYWVIVCFSSLFLTINHTVPTIITIIPLTSLVKMAPKPYWYRYEVETVNDDDSGEFEYLNVEEDNTEVHLGQDTQHSQATYAALPDNSEEEDDEDERHREKAKLPSPKHAQRPLLIKSLTLSSQNTKQPEPCGVRNSNHGTMRKN
jgi:hypothetical protein